ncbi:MAG: hypothetical protein AB8C95_15555, partial [Phycisphaeraceae bacterium]
SKEQPERVRFFTDGTAYPNQAVIEFTDHATIELECFRVSPDGSRRALWSDTLSPYSDGLGNTILIEANPELTFRGRGSPSFSHAIGVDPSEINLSTRGHSASLKPSNVVWYCLLKVDGSSNLLNPDIVPTLPEGIEDVEAAAKANGCDAIVLVASVVTSE